MTTTTAPAPAIADQRARHDRIRNRADALHAHADGIAPAGRNPITGDETVSRPAWAIAHAIDGADGYSAIGQVAECRAKVTTALASDNLTMNREQANGHAQRAMAAIGREADTRRPASSYRPAYLRDYLIGDYYPVGPYVGDAVEWALRGVEHTAADRGLVEAYATLHNVVTRGL